MSVYSGCLKNIITNILNTSKTTAKTYGLGKDYLASANIPVFENVADTMIAQGICLSTIKLEEIRLLIKAVGFLYI